MRAFAAPSLLSAAACALICFLLARRYAFSHARRIGWALGGLLFGWVGLQLMLAVQEWPARVVCPGCRKRRVVSRDTCAHCGAPHAAPAPDGTEIFETTAEVGRALCTPVYQAATWEGEDRRCISADAVSWSTGGHFGVAVTAVLVRQLDSRPAPEFSLSYGRLNLRQIIRPDQLYLRHLRHPRV